MPPRQPSHPAFIALLAVVVLTQPALATPVAPAGPPGGTAAVDGLATQPDPCAIGDDSGRLDALTDTERHDAVERIRYASGLGNASAGDWTGGTVVRIGARGDCSLAVTNETATLTAVRVNGTTGLVRATVDVGRNGSFLAVAAPNRTGETSAADGRAVGTALGVANAGRANDIRVAIVARNGTGTYHREVVNASTGRFVDLAMRWTGDGRVRLALRDPARTEVAVTEWDATVAVPRNATWRLRLGARAYLDEVAVGTRPDAAADERTATVGGDDAGAGEAGADEDGTEPGDPVPADQEPGDRPVEDDGTAGGFVLGPIVAIGGFLLYRYAYRVAQFEEQIDAIGSKTAWSDVEPADWKVGLQRVVAVGVLLAGIGWFLTAVASAIG